MLDERKPKRHRVKIKPPGPHLSSGWQAFRVAVDRTIEAGISLAEQADSLDWLPQTLSHFYNGRRVPTLDQAIQIEDRYGVPVTDWRF